MSAARPARVLSSSSMMATRIGGGGCMSLRIFYGLSNGGRAAYSCGIASPKSPPALLERDPQADAASLARMAFHLECGIQRACPDSHVSQPVSGALRGVE